MIVPDPDEATETQHRVRNPPRSLVNHDAFNRSDLLFIRSIHGSALNLIAADQTDSLSFLRSHDFLLLDLPGLTGGSKMHVRLAGPPQKAAAAPTDSNRKIFPQYLTCQGLETAALLMQLISEETAAKTLLIIVATRGHDA